MDRKKRGGRALKQLSRIAYGLVLFVTNPITFIRVLNNEPVRGMSYREMQDIREDLGLKRIPYD